MVMMSRFQSVQKYIDNLFRIHLFVFLFNNASFIIIVMFTLETWNSSYCDKQQKPVTMRQRLYINLIMSKSMAKDAKQLAVIERITMWRRNHKGFRKFDSTEKRLISFLLMWLHQQVAKSFLYYGKRKI